MPLKRYEDRLPFFDSVFASGVEPYVHPTGVTGVKLVVGVDEASIDPFRLSPYGRSAKSGSVSIFIADSEETARAEVFQGSPPSQYPENTWLLRYRYKGNILNIQKIQEEEFRQEFLMSSGEYKHEFSQDVRRYLEENGHTRQFDSIGWVSVQGEQMGTGGFVYNWVSGVMPEFEYLGMDRLDYPSGGEL
jgi:hypothetical protein